MVLVDRYSISGIGLLFDFCFVLPAPVTKNTAKAGRREHDSAFSALALFLQRTAVVINVRRLSLFDLVLPSPISGRAALLSYDL